MENGNTYDYDLVTIGAGSGGTRASRFSAQHYGAKVAIVELPFRQIADDDHGGAGGTWVNALHFVPATLRDWRAGIFVDDLPNCYVDL